MKNGIYNSGKEEDFIVDKQDEFIAYQACLFQMITGDKFLPGLLALTGSEILIFNDYAPSEKIGVMNYSLNKGDLAEIQELLIDICNDTSKIPEYDYFGNMSNFISSCYRNAGEIQKILLLLKDYSFIYEYLGDDEYERAGRFTENNDLIIEIESIEVYFEDSY